MTNTPEQKPQEASPRRKLNLLSGPFSVVVWALALVALAGAGLSIASLTGYVRLATVSDGSSAPVAFAGSLAVTLQKPSTEVQLGDVLLVGAHSSGGSTLGEVVDISEEGENLAVTLKAPALSQPDQWSYELGTNAYEQLFSIPLLGYPFELLERLDVPAAAVILVGLFAWIFIVAIRYLLFRGPAADEPHWFAKLPPHERDEVEELSQLFQEAGADAPYTFVEEDTSWTRRRRA